MCCQGAADMRLFIFYLSHKLVPVFEIELPHIGRNSGNPDLVYEKIITKTIHNVSCFYSKYSKILKNFSLSDLK